jgi:hypothetical protein
VRAHDRTRRAVWILAGMLLAGCGGPPLVKPVPDARLDPSLAPQTWIEEGNLVALVVSTRAARGRLGEAYLPIEIAVVNKGLSVLTLTPESFVLVDARGARYPLASRSEIRSAYGGSVDADTRNVEAARIVPLKFESYRELDSNFAPSSQASAAIDSIPLPIFTYVLDFLYFPRPADLRQGEPLELTVSSPELEDPVYVRFTVR